MRSNGVQKVLAATVATNTRTTPISDCREEMAMHAYAQRDAQTRTIEHNQTQAALHKYT
jgi:hypothetical protein